MSTHSVVRSERCEVLQRLDQSIPLLDLKAQFDDLRVEVLHAVTSVLESQQFILGPEVEALEREVSAYVGSRFAVGCASGSDALLLALVAIGVMPGDEVITSPFTFGATAGSIARLGARPVFIDIKRETFNLDEDLIEEGITRWTKAILPVHLFGRPADMDAILAIAQRHNLAVIEDAAQAIGARWRGDGVGSLGTCGCFSFFPSKNLGCAGDGGMITTDNPAIAHRLRLLRAHGTERKYHYELVGINSRLDAIQASILRIKLRHLDDWTLRRRAHAVIYEQLFSAYGLSEKVALPQASGPGYHVYNQYSIRAAHRDALRCFLRDRRIGTEIYYPAPLHTEPAFAGLCEKRGELLNAQSVCDEVLSLPIYPELTRDQQRGVVSAIAEFYNTHV